ncbi:invasion associated locus B family protein [Frigidibacter sp.]|uniref:invasion associated locus B family protein n=1 Tax=Frigidibacter sp. TaxID=2586418 RepID=UPI002734D2C8|nr:invasion associated locus B family protein [Frigidibacter sp.]MDP3341540.1 invasion associated locus B family protein [Frigidibacter sp.]
MTSRILRGIAGPVALAAAFAVTLTGLAGAQESTNRVAAKTDWSVFVEESPKECWGVSAPKETVNSRDGQPTQVRRGDILLFITYRPGGGAGEVSFTGGYPFAGGSTVELDVGGTKYNLFTDGEWAWSGSKDEDAKIVASLKAGTSAILTARSGRGTQTRDTFSLLGFTAAMDEAAKRCAS